MADRKCLKWLQIALWLSHSLKIIKIQGGSEAAKDAA